MFYLDLHILNTPAAHQNQLVNSEQLSSRASFTYLSGQRDMLTIPGYGT